MQMAVTACSRKCDIWTGRWVRKNPLHGFCAGFDSPTVHEVPLDTEQFESLL